ncbi:Class V chitinase [Cardamine amara subsp. amara]|uniref:Class V chitinase n=1 Tax=Cardamine amara subsp. amara TaxID=228776 RepID=A0ABD1AEM6_CARAN
MSLSVVKASYWFSSPDFPATDIDSSLFTHLFCAFADLDASTNEITISTDNQSDFQAFTETVQKRNPSVQTLLSIGGGNSDKSAFASMASNPNSRRSFIDSSIRVARSYGFYGLDLDWEYPRDAAEMTDFGTLLQEWRSAVEAESSSTGIPPLLLTAAVYYSSNLYSLPYPVLDVANSLDWVNLMAYDFYGPAWSDVTGPPACLYAPPNGGRSGDSGVKEWTGAGLPAKKAVLGLPYYGWAWTLQNPDNNGYDAATTGPALSISESGEIGYRQLKGWIGENGPEKVADTTVVGDYCYAGTTWIGYDSVDSVVTKVNYAKENGLLGYFSWHVGGDDNSELSFAGQRAWEDTAETE